ncbi:ROK family protein [Microbacterium sp.]|uniref:ROK family protein n=1 Tax=Microbacterium sp. TaxID=51671 RepID=UPI003A83BDDA
MLSVGIDIGGTKIAGGVVSPGGDIVDRARVQTPREPAAIAVAVAEMVTGFETRHEVGPVGVAAAAFIDADRAVVLHAPNIAWQNEPLRDRVQQLLGRAITLENDANAAGWGEYRYGAGRGSRGMAMLTLGTGVGGAVVVGGTLLTGAFGIAGELGHLRSVPGGRRCGCGQTGCLEQYASGRALQAEAAEVAEDAEIGAALRAAQTADGRIDGTVIARLVAASDPGALRAVDRVGRALGEACGQFQAIFDPERFVIGGGVAQLGEPLLRPVRASFAAAVPGVGHRPIADIVPATLGNDAGLIGVADLAGERS